MVAGLAWQVLSLVVFMVLWLEFTIRAMKVDEEEKPANFAELRAARKFKLFQIGELISLPTY